MAIPDRKPPCAREVNSSRTVSPEAAGSNLTGVAWAALAVGIFAFIYLAGKLTGSSASAMQIMWLRYVGGLITVLALIIVSRTRRAELTTTQAPVHALRAAAGGFGGVAAVYAAANMPVVSASAIGLMDGVFTVLLGVLIFRERVSGRQYAAAALCLIGAIVVLMSKGALAGFGSSSFLPVAVGLAGAFSVAVESVLIKKLARSEKLLSVLLYVNIFGVLIFAPLGLLNWSWVDSQQLIFFLLLGPMAIAAQSCNIKALRHSDVSVIAPVRYVWIIYGMVFGWFLFGEKVTTVGLLGAGLVLLGGLWLALTRTSEARTHLGGQSRPPA
jgi:drug/metabolite transporter (DMT)-like permease